MAEVVFCDGKFIIYGFFELFDFLLKGRVLQEVVLDFVLGDLALGLLSDLNCKDSHILKNVIKLLVKLFEYL